MLGLLLGTAVSIFFFTNKLLNQFENNFNQDDVDILIEKIILEKNSLEEEIEKLKIEHERLTNTVINDDDRIKIDILNKKLDLVEINGEGLIVHIEYNNNFSYDTPCIAPHIRDIRNVLNLKELSLQGISINHQRLGYNSVINCIGNGLIIDNKRVISPFNIRIIGNKTKIYNTLLTKKFLPSVWNDVERGMFSFDISERDNIVLEQFEGNLRFEYINNKQ